MLMFAQRPSLWKYDPLAVCCRILILAVLSHLAAAKQWNNCSHPVVPEHGGFRCDPSPCRGFPLKSTVHYFCEEGFSLPPRVHSSHCRRGKWYPSVPSCLPNPEGHPNVEERSANSLPSVATTAVGVSIFLLTTTACMVIKSRLYPCHSHNSRRSSDQVDLMVDGLPVDGLPVSLPTYEEAVYGSCGQRLPPSRGPTQLLLAQEAPGTRPLSPHIQSESGSSRQPAGQSAAPPPPPYEEVRSHPGGALREDSARALQNGFSVRKDTYI